MRGWHFMRGDRRMRYGDGMLVEPGNVYTFDGEPILCQQGLHASIGALDALSYAPGPIVCRVECRGTIARGEDKVACTEREVLWMADATETIREFARLCALDVIHVWDPPEVVGKYLRTGDESLRSAASAAAWTAASAAARAAARNAASAAANAASAARDAARDAQEGRLTRMLRELGSARPTPSSGSRPRREIEEPTPEIVTH